MRDVDVDVLHALPALLQHGLCGRHENARRELEHLAPVHLHQPVRILEAAGAAARQPEVLAAGAVGAELEGEEACLLRRLEHDRAGAVSEQDDRRAVGPVEDAGKHVAADHERAPREARRHHPVGLRKRVHEAGAAGGEVVRGRVLRAQLVGKDRRGRGEHHVRRHGRDDQEVDVRPVAAGLLERLPRCGHREVGERLRVRGDAALADARALDDPLVRRVDHLRELVVRDHPLGRVGPEAGDRHVDVAAALADHPLFAPDEDREHRLDGDVAVDARAALSLRDRAAHAQELALEVEDVPRLDDPLEATVVDPGEEGNLAAVRLVGKHGDRAALGDRLDRQDARHHRAVGEVALKPPPVLGHEKAPAHLPAGLELENLVHEQEGVPVRDDRLDRLPPERRCKLGHATSRCSSRSRRRFLPRCAWHLAVPTGMPAAAAISSNV